MLKSYQHLVLAIGIGSEGTVTLEYLKEKGLGNIDFLFPDENLSARDLANYKLVFLVGGMQDLVTVGMAINIANIAKELAVLTIGIMTMLPSGDTPTDARHFSEETESLKDAVDLLILISTNVFPETENGPSFRDIHENAHFQIWLAAKTIVDVMSFNGVVGVDFEDVRTITRGGGYGILSFGQASGKDRVKKAVLQAMPASSTISDQSGNILLYMYYGQDEITIGEIGDIVQFFQNQVNSHGDILWNCGYDPTLQDDLRISVIWTGLENPAIELNYSFYYFPESSL